MCGSIALSREGGLVAERDLPSGEKRARTLVSEVQELLRTAGHHPSNCDLIAVSTGPGSFTGLRIGVVFAKTWAYATGCRIVGVETLRSIAHNAPADVARVQVAMNAQRGELFVGEFERHAEAEWSKKSPLKIVSTSDWQASLNASSVVMGPALEALAKDLADRSPCRILEMSTWHPRAAIVAQLGERAAAAGELADPWTLEPLYVRKSAAEEKWDAAHRGKEG